MWRGGGGVQSGIFETEKPKSTLLAELTTPKGLWTLHLLEHWERCFTTHWQCVNVCLFVVTNIFKKSHLLLFIPPIWIAVDQISGVMRSFLQPLRESSDSGYGYGIVLLDRLVTKRLQMSPLPLCQHDSVSEECESVRARWCMPWLVVCDHKIFRLKKLKHIPSVLNLLLSFTHGFLGFLFCFCHCWLD